MHEIFLNLDSGSYEIDSAECGCAAGRGPKASSKHLQHCVCLGIVCQTEATCKFSNLH